MTKAEAIELLRELSNFVATPPETDEAINMAIKALEQDEQDDTISRQVAIEALTEIQKMKCGDDDHAIAEWTGATECIARIELLPSTDRHGAWVYCEDEAGHDGFKCEKCDTFYPWYYEYYHSADDFISDYNFCPHCGARIKTT
jgi:hypothetical protein